MRLDGLDIAIIAQHGVAMFDAEGADDDVGGFPDRNAQGSQAPDQKPALLGGYPTSTALDGARRPPPQAGEVQRRPELAGGYDHRVDQSWTRLRPDHLSEESISFG
jgi:hypothetical protein